jgi:sugar phosphate isomerase/epimerase
MKLSVITDEISQDFEHALDVMLEYNVYGAELRGLWGANISDLSAQQIARAKEALQKRGMTVSCLSTPIFKCDILSEDTGVYGAMHLATGRGLSEQMDLIRRCCDIAHLFDVRLLRVFSFWKKGYLNPDLERRIIDAFSEPIQIAEKEDILLALENEHSCYLGTAEETARVVTAVNSPWLRVCWDPGNAFFAGEKPYPDGYNRIKPYMVHFHIKDAKHDKDGAPIWTVVGEGDIDFTGQFDSLKEDGYQGYCSLETHFIPADGTPEDGSRACLQSLRRLTKD